MSRRNNYCVVNHCQGTKPLDLGIPAGLAYRTFHSWLSRHNVPQPTSPLFLLPLATAERKGRGLDLAGPRHSRGQEGGRVAQRGLHCGMYSGLLLCCAWCGGGGLLLLPGACNLSVTSLSPLCSGGGKRPCLWWIHDPVSVRPDMARERRGRAGRVALRGSSMLGTCLSAPF